MLQDRNFDNLIDKFKKQIYSTAKGDLRLALLNEDLAQHIPLLDAKPRDILDAGGGMGQFSAQLAARGHRITLCDISTEMLNLAREEFQLVAPDATPQFIHTPLQELPRHIEKQQDLVLFHAVIEWLQDPYQALKQLNQLVKPGGWLSVLFYNRKALVWRHLMNGNWDKARSKTLIGRKNSLTPINPQNPETIEQWLQELGYECHAWTGMRAVYDNMKDKERKKKTFSELLDIEREFGRQEPFRTFSRYIHILAKKAE